MIEPGFTVYSIGLDGPATAHAKALILATGALERHVPIPGWTLPGVVGLAAAAILLKSQAVLPGYKVVVAGTGPMLPLVANGILKGGGQVAAIVDATPRSSWLRQLPALLSRPDLLVRGAGWVARLAARGVPILSGHALSMIDGDREVQRAFAVPLDRNGSPRPGAKSREVACDAVCYGFG